MVPLVGAIKSGSVYEQNSELIKPGFMVPEQQSCIMNSIEDTSFRRDQKPLDSEEKQLLYVNYVTNGMNPETCPISRGLF